MSFGSEIPKFQFELAAFKRTADAHQDLAKGCNEPTPDPLNLCCVRSQHGYCCNSVNSDAAVPREKWPFIVGAAKSIVPMTELRDTTDLEVPEVNSCF